MSYQIKTVAELLGIPRNTLIAWERRYKVVDPQRTSSGYRVYSEDDVQTLLRVKALLDRGFRISEACRMVSEEEAAEPPALPKSSGAALHAIRDDMRDALLEFDRGRADRLVARLLMVPYEQTLQEVYFPLLYEVGARWERGEVTVVQEHYVSAYCREKFMVLMHSLHVPGGSGEEIICATPPGEYHELGCMGIALRLALRGYSLVYLGANVPTRHLVEHVRRRKPFGICISFVHDRRAEEVARYGRALRQDIDRSVHIAFGGRGLTGMPRNLVDGVDIAGSGLPEWLAAGPKR